MTEHSSHIDSTLPLLHKQHATHPHASPTPDQPAGPPTRSSSRLGTFYLFLCALFYSTHSILIRLAETTFAVPIGLTIYIRALIHILGALLYFAFSYTPSDLFTWTLTRKQSIFLLFRGLAGTISLLMLYIGVPMIRIGDAISVFFISPIFTFILAGIFLSESITIRGLIAVLLSAVGTLLIAVGQNQDVDGESIVLTTRILGLSMMVLGAFFASLAYTVIRTLGMSVSFMSSVLSFACCCFVISLFYNDMNGFPWREIAALRIEGLVATISLGLASFIAQCFLNLGLQRCKAGPGILITNVEVPVVFLLGAVFLHEYPNAMSICGSALILSAAIVIGLEKMNRQREEES